LNVSVMPTGHNMPDASVGIATMGQAMSGPLVSILINNYNYARFLGEAIDSALSQDYPTKEVLVVDDGSTDNSREIIARCGDRIVPIFKKNGGQTSAFNAGVAASRGEILCFLDADDLFHPQKVTQVVKLFCQQGVNTKPMMVQHLLAVKSDNGEDVDGRPYGKTHDASFNLYPFAQRYRFVWYEAGPTTSLSVNRTLARMIFPLPETGVRVSGDDFIVCGASLLGEVYSINHILGRYRVHGNNYWFHTDRRKSPKFLGRLQSYLNDKLVENGLSPVISFDNSIYAWSGLVDDHRWLKLAWHMFKLSVKQHDRYTALFAYYTLMKIGMLGMKSLRGRTRRLATGLHL
jgi:glycosyltransferase involved in cell wall biosynthesis